MKKLSYAVLKEQDVEAVRLQQIQILMQHHRIRQVTGTAQMIFQSYQEKMVPVQEEHLSNYLELKKNKVIRKLI